MSKIDTGVIQGNYYEAHVTIEPVFNERLDEFKSICRKYKFRVAELFMKKSRNDTEERSSADSFCTSRGSDFSELHERTKALVVHLDEASFSVWRYKIEDALIDVKFD